VRSGPDSSTRSFHVSLSWFFLPRLRGEPLRTPASYQRRRHRDKCVRAATVRTSPSQGRTRRMRSLTSMHSKGAARTGAL
jgi:hypothetical protein